MFSPAAMALGHSVHARLTPTAQSSTLSGAPSYVFRTLGADQSAAVAEIAERILPATDTPGAKAARVDEFIDLMLTEWFTAEERHAFLRGLGQLETASRSRHQTAFTELEPEQMDGLLNAAEQEAVATREDVVVADGAAASDVSPASGPFFDVMKWLTLFGYYTSEVGMTEELEWEVFPGTYDGDAVIRKRG